MLCRRPHATAGSRWPLLAGAAGLLLSLVSPGGASAAATVGQTGGNPFPCGGLPVTVFQRQLASGPSYSVPSSGVITAWRHEAPASSAQSAVRLKVFRLVSGSTYEVVGESAPETAAAGLNSFATRIPVNAGDVIALTALTGNPTCGFATGNGGDHAGGGGGGDAPPRTRVDLAAGTDVQQVRVDVAALVEPDADADGRGDETQDACPGFASPDNSCPADLSLAQTANPTAAHPGDQVTFSLTVTNGGPAPGAGVTLSDSLPSSMSLVAAASSAGPCSEGPPITCALGSLPVNQSAAVTIVATANAPGLALNAASTRGSTTDPDPGNNGASAAIDVTAGAAGPPVNAPTAANDTLNGTASDDIMCGLAGDDTINGLQGNDTLFGDACGQKARLAAAQAGSSGNDRLTGAEGDDTLYGGGGRDALDGASGSDKLFGGRGNDSLNGGAGRDALDGGAGNDKLTGGPGPDSYHGGAGNDTITSTDRRKETVDCGAGRRDSARVDRSDRVRGCEKVRRTP